MQCPRCLKEDVTSISDTHYVCNNPDCFDDNHNRTQFKLVIDPKIKFPYNQIYVDRKKEEFYRKPYLEFNAAEKTK